jgi:hypothetical protein
MPTLKEASLVRRLISYKKLDSHRKSALAKRLNKIEMILESRKLV